jgi:hypothetical protein
MNRAPIETLPDLPREQISAQALQIQCANCLKNLQIDINRN